MKLQVTFKCPDALDEAIIQNPSALCSSEEEKAAVLKIAEKWIEYGEYVTIEIDTEKKTAKVLEA